MASPSVLLQESACWWQPCIGKTKIQTYMRFQAHIPLVGCQFAWLHTFRWLETVFRQQVIIQCVQTCVHTCWQVFSEMCGFCIIARAVICPNHQGWAKTAMCEGRYGIYSEGAHTGLHAKKQHALMGCFLVWFSGHGGALTLLAYSSVQNLVQRKPS